MVKTQLLHATQELLDACAELRRSISYVWWTERVDPVLRADAQDKMCKAFTNMRRGEYYVEQELKALRKSSKAEAGETR